jgi:hypothetical protein
MRVVTLERRHFRSIRVPGGDRPPHDVLPIGEDRVQRGFHVAVPQRLASQPAPQRAPYDAGESRRREREVEPDHQVGASCEEAFIVHREDDVVKLTVRSLTGHSQTWQWRALYPQSVFVLLGTLGATMPFLAVGVGRPWLRQSLGRWRSGWWALAAAVAFASASICLTFVLLVGAAPRDSRVGQLEATAPWLGGPLGPGGWALLIVTYLALTGAAFVVAFSPAATTDRPSTVLVSYIAISSPTSTLPP